MAIPVMVKVETKTKSPGIIPESWHNTLILGPIHVLYNVWTNVTGDITVQSSKSLIAKFTIKMLLTWKIDTKTNSEYLINYSDKFTMWYRLLQTSVKKVPEVELLAILNRHEVFVFQLCLVLKSFTYTVIHVNKVLRQKQKTAIAITI